MSESDLITSLDGLLDELDTISGRIHYVDATPYQEHYRSRLLAVRQLLTSKLRFELHQRFAPPLIVQIIGGANVGKSTLFNLLIGAEVAKPAATAGATKNPALYVHRDRLPVVEQPTFLIGYRKERLEDPERLNQHAGDPVAYFLAHDQPALADLLLFDSPDMDSLLVENAKVCRDALWMADVTVLVCTDQKYLDARPLEIFTTAIRLGKHVAVVFNKMIDEARYDTIRSHLEEVMTGEWRVPTGSVRFFMLPHRRREELVPGGEGDELVAPIRDFLLTLPTDTSLKRTTFASSWTHLRTELHELGERHRDELDVVTRTRNELEDIVAAAETTYRDFAERLSNDDFFELSEAVRRIVASYKIPGIDTALDKVREGFVGLGGLLGRTLGMTKRPSPEEERRLARKDKNYKRSVELIEESIVRFHNHLRSHRDTSPIIANIHARVVELVSVDARLLRTIHDREYSRIDTFAIDIERRIREWLAENPNKERWIVAFKLLLRVGIGGLAAVLTGGMHMNDLLIGPLAAVGAEFLVGHLSPPNFFREFRERFVADHLAIFRAMYQGGYGHEVQKAFPLDGRGVPFSFAKLQRRLEDAGELVGKLTEQREVTR